LKELVSEVKGHLCKQHIPLLRPVVNGLQNFVWLQYNVDEPEQEKYNLTYT